MKDTLPVRVRFGIFELDLKSGELWEGGRKVVLPEQPFLVLRILVENGGQVVSREEIQKKLWPNDTVVEFDHSINAAINKLRRVLGDSAEEPKYIETLARRGYRLMAPVEWLDSASGDNLPSSEASDSHEEAVEPPRPEPASLSGKTVSHYRVLEIIGGGGMGVVYRAEDLKLPRSVALKFLPEELGSDPRALGRFELEARAASTLEHPNICPIYEFGEHAGQPFIVMQFLQGQTLRDRMAAQTADESETGADPFAVDELLGIAIQIAHGLEAAHEKGLIHRDIKPANIFLTNKGVVKILDFGLVKFLEPSGETPMPPEAGGQNGPEEPRPKIRGSHITRLGFAVGTAGYMSPEQVRSEEVDARADLFSFGVVLYEMATGQRAFGGKTEARVRAAIAEDTPVPVHELNATLPPELEPIINKALEKNRELRYQSAAAMRADLEALKRSKEPLPPPPSLLRASKTLRWKSWQLAAAVLVCAFVIAGGVYAYWRWYGYQKITDKDSMVLADFTNLTTDPVFDDALNRAFQVELKQTPFMNVLAPDKVRGALKQMKRAENSKLTPELAREVCVRTNSKAVVTGSIADAGNLYRIKLQGVNCQTGKAFATSEKETTSRDEIVRTLGMAGAELRSKMGEPRTSVQQFNKPLDEATSSSLEALQAVAEAVRQKSQHGDASAAFSYLKRAVELDPKFAQAYLALGIGYFNVNQLDLSAENLRKAFELRERADPRGRFSIEAAYYNLTTGEVEKSIQTYTQWAATYPQDPIAHGNLSAALQSVGLWEKALEEAQKSVRLWQTGFAYVNLMTSDLSLDRLQEAQATFEEARAAKVDDPNLYVQRYLLAFLQGDKPAMKEQLTSAKGKPVLENQLLCAQSRTESFYGRVGNARQFTQQGVDSASQARRLEAAAQCKVDLALVEAEIGNQGEALKAAKDTLALSAGRNAKTSVALAMARGGELANAESLADKLNHDYPQDTLMQNYLLPTIRAAIELQKSNPSKAIDILQVTMPYDLGFGSFGALYPAYVRGEAYLKAGQGEQAAAEFRKVLDHPGITGNFVLGALAHLQLGRAQAMMGDNLAARNSYQDFFKLWKDADPDVPILKQAKAEYAKLQ